MPLGRPISLAATLVIMSLITACGARHYDPVYRYINVLTGTQVYLGEEFSAAGLADPIDDSTYALRPGTFAGGGTVSIVAHVNKTGTLRALLFVYDGSETLEQKVRSYTEALGPPSEVISGPNGSLHVWQDSQTRFELHVDLRGAPEFWSLLSDREGR